MDFPAPGENANAWRGALRPRRKGCSRARAFERVRFSALLKLGEAPPVLIFLGVVLRRCISDRRVTRRKPAARHATAAIDASSSMRQHHRSIERTLENLIRA